MPLYSGSRGGASLIYVANVPANATAGVVTFPVPPIADSPSHNSVLVTRPTCEIEVRLPERMSPLYLDGIIVAVANRENAKRHHQHRQDSFLPGCERDPENALVS